MSFYRHTIELRQWGADSQQPTTIAMTLSGKGRKPGKIVGDSFRHQVADRIRTRRLELQMRAEDAAEHVGDLLGRSVNVQTWYHWEKGEHPFDIDVLDAIAAALKCNPRDLIPSHIKSGDHR